MTTRNHALDSLRGIAALQVLLCHGLLLYAPVLFDLNGPALTVVRSPISTLWDGGLAVCLFFVISGYVLTFAYSSATPAIAHVGSRVVRLALPAFLSCCLAAALIGLFGYSAPEAAALVPGNTGLGVGPTPGLGLPDIVTDTLRAVFLGYSPIGPASQLQWEAPSNLLALNPVLWTLSIEFWGSLIILALTRIHPLVRTQAAVVALVYFVGSFYGLFLAGYLAASAPRAQRLVGGIPPWGCILLLIFGVWSAHPSNLASAQWLNFACGASPSWFAPCGPYPGKALGSLALFFGVLGSAPILRVLALPPMRRLGALSFPLYLVHFPIIATVSAGVALALAPNVGVGLAYGTAFVLAICLSIAVAFGFIQVDLLAIGLARRTKAKLT